MVTLTSGTDIFNGMLGDIDYPEDSKAGRLYPFKVRVACIYRRPPRHEFFEYIIDMGRFDIEKVFKDSKIGKNHLTFVFPERWMSVIEEQAFMSRLSLHQEVNEIKNVDIVTSSPMMISSFMGEQIRIIKWDDDHEFEYAMKKWKNCLNS